MTIIQGIVLFLIALVAVVVDASSWFQDSTAE